MQHSAPVAFGISLLAVALAVLFVVSVRRAVPVATSEDRRRITLRTAALTVAWMTLMAGLALSGWFAQFDQRPPPMLFMMALSVGAGVAVGVSRVGAWLSTLPLAWLVGWQAFRLPLELTMHHAANVGLMPSVMSYSGYNFDIVTGTSALALALWLFHSKKALPKLVLVLWNALGTALLMIVLGVALLSSPFLRFFGEDQVNRWVAYFPYVWLPAVLVSTAAMGHIVIARRLLEEGRALRAGGLTALIEARR
jgi:hypothetical protein